MACVDIGEAPPKGRERPGGRKKPTAYLRRVLPRTQACATCRNAHSLQPRCAWVRTGDAEYRELTPEEVAHVKTANLTGGSVQVRDLEDGVLRELIRKGLLYIEVLVHVVAAPQRSPIAVCCTDLQQRPGVAGLLPQCFTHYDAPTCSSVPVWQGCSNNASHTTMLCANTGAMGRCCCSRARTWRAHNCACTSIHMHA